MSEKHELFVIWDLVKDTFGQKKPKFYHQSEWADRACKTLNIAHKLPVNPPRDRYKVVTFALDWKSQVGELIKCELPETAKKKIAKATPKKETIIKKPIVKKEATVKVAPKK